MDTLMKGIKPMNAEKKQFEDRKNSKLLAQFGDFFRLSDF